MEAKALKRLASDHPPIIGIIGGEVAPDDALSDARQVGRLIAERGGIVVCGGGAGVMEAVCEGAHAIGGVTVGILPEADRSGASPYLTIPIVTAMSTARNAIIVRTADVLIAIDGRFGTLTEIAYALDIGQKLVLLHSWPLERMAIDERRFHRVNSAEEAVDLAFRLAGRRVR